MEGIGEDFIPSIADLSSVRHAYSISDEESFDHARQLLKAEGILGGSSTGTLLAAALRYCREQTEPKRVVTFVCDTGTRYLSKVYNDQWMNDAGLLQYKHYGDLRDLIARRFEDGRVISVNPLRIACGEDSLVVKFGQRNENGLYLAGPSLADELGLVDGSVLRGAESGRKPRRTRVTRPWPFNAWPPSAASRWYRLPT